MKSPDIGLVITDPEPLDYDHVPDELVGRESLQRALASKFSAVASPGGAARAIITGPVGSGKTVLAKTFCRDLQRHLSGKRSLKTVHVNCRNASTSMRVAQRILHQFDPGHPDRGLSLGELLLSVRKMIRRNGTHLVVVLDEVDHMLRRSGDELLYQLLRIDEDQEGSGSVSLILVSQEQVLDVLETAVISKFGQSNHLRVPRYDLEGLEAIARQRAMAALSPGSWTDEMLSLIAKKARQDEHTVPEISVQDINEVVASSGSVYVGDRLEVVDDLNAQVMLALLAMCRRLRNQERMTMGDVEGLYQVVCEEYEQKPKSHTTLWKYVKTLVQEGIVDSHVATVEGGRGRTTHLSMPNLLPSDIAGRLELLLPKRLQRR